MRQYAASVDDSEKFISYRTNKLYLSLNMYRFFSHLTRQGFQKHSSRRYDTKNSMMRLLMKIGFISTTLHLPPLHFSSFHKCSISCQFGGLRKKIPFVSHSQLYTDVIHLLQFSEKPYWAPVICNLLFLGK